jgi:hypothetical protein
LYIAEDLMTSSMARATGIAWYRQEEYARLKKLFKDGRKLPDTFAVWHKRPALYMTT